MRGQGWRGILREIEKVVPGGVAAVQASIEDEALSTFVGTRFLPSVYYDILPAVPVLQASARLAGKRFLEHSGEMATSQAQTDLGGIFRFILGLSSPEAVVNKMPFVVRHYFNFGELVVVEKAPRVWTLRRSGVPGSIAGWYGVLASAFNDEALRASGAANPLSRVVDITADGQGHGVPLKSVVFETTWEP